MDIPNLNWPLMQDNITREDLDALIAYLRQPSPRLTHGAQVRAFEQEWAEWLGVKHSVLVNSGASANLLTLAAIRYRFGGGEIIVPPLGWVSDVAAVLQNGFTPVFVDIDRRTLGLDTEQAIEKLSPNTRAVLVIHILGFNALSKKLVTELGVRGIPLLEDACESHGATFAGRKVGAFGLISNFSYYFAHHMSTIEGGMICTNDDELYQMLRMLRSHGMVRECTDATLRQRYAASYPDLNPDFIFAFPAYNLRPTELTGVLGRSQLKRLDANNELRRQNFNLFLQCLDPSKYQTDFAVEGSCNYAFTLVLREPDTGLRDRVEAVLRAANVEFRRGLSGGGNQLRQPYLRQLLGSEECEKYPNVNHVHFFGWYIGNYPELPKEKIYRLCDLLNKL
ncbi:MAG: DegT/DnrJ/EryC1/StrS aminotransferase family protein [Verrucomicrobiae bacterium]|nr:DegT/DnrJ/EryC1/StrS aminotransferase family protein [Verrucomicrobiae bacterium]